MSEPGEVNGVRFLAGTIIDAQTRDADKLIRSGKAVRVDEDGNIIKHHDDDSIDSDSDTNGSDETPEAVDNDSSASLETGDHTNADAPQRVNEAGAEIEADQPQGVHEHEAEIEADQSQQADADEAPKAPTS